MGAIGLLAVVLIAYFFFHKPSVSVGTPISFTVWGTEPAENVKPALDAYRAIHPNVSYLYKEQDPATYEARLIDALAAGAGPDLFMIPSTDVGHMRDKLAPAPATLTLQTLQENFPKAVETDVMDGGNVYGLPLSLDTLVLIYNRDLLDAAGITAPPATWDEVVADVPQLAAIDDQAQVQRAAIALGGTSASVRNAADILSLLMLQNGSPLANQAHSSVSLGAGGEAALRFYAQFANPGSSAYTWNEQLGDAYQQFADGKLAMLVAYPSATRTIQALNAYVDARISGVPQTSGGTPRSFGSYPLLVVSRQSPRAAAAWDLITGITTSKTIMSAYSAQTGQAPALMSVIADQAKNPATALAATQALQARSWFQWNGTAAEDEFDRAITSVINGSADPARASFALEQRLRALIRR